MKMLLCSCHTLQNISLFLFTTYEDEVLSRVVKLSAVFLPMLPTSAPTSPASVSDIPT